MTRLIGMVVPLALVAGSSWLVGLVRIQTQLSALPAEVRSPPDNPSTPDKIELGRLLFWDAILSGTRDVACATCHHPDFGYAESLDISIGEHGAGLGVTRRFDAGG